MTREKKTSEEDLETEMQHVSRFSLPTFVYISSADSDFLN